MTIADITIKSEDDWKFNPFIEAIEYKVVDFGSYIHYGFFKTGTLIRHGIGRTIAKNKYIDEGMYIDNGLTGYGR